MNEWHYQHNGAEHGPIEESRLAQLLRSGAIPHAAPVSADDRKIWKPANTVDAFKVDDPNANDALRNLLLSISRGPMASDTSPESVQAFNERKVAEANIVVGVMNGKQHILYAHDGDEHMDFISAAEALAHPQSHSLVIAQFGCRDESGMNDLRAIIRKVKVED